MVLICHLATHCDDDGKLSFLKCFLHTVCSTVQAQLSTMHHSNIKYSQTHHKLSPPAVKLSFLLLSS